MHQDYFVQFIGAFSGAFFAFLFFLSGEWIKRKIEWNKTVRNEHAYLERYFPELYQAVEYNKGLLSIIVKDYKNKIITLMNLVPVPIREDISMKIKDTIFINKIEIYVANLKRLNLTLNNINKWKEKIDEELLNSSEEIKKRAENSLANFIKQAEEFQKVFDFHLKEAEEFAAENRLLLRRYKNWNYRKQKVEKEYKKRKNLVDLELQMMHKEGSENTIMNDYIEKLKKSGIYEDKSINY